MAQTLGRSQSGVTNELQSAASKERIDRKREKPRVKDLNDHIVCPLCRGYLIDATTLVECLHSFCRGCIVRRLKNGPKNCPVCNAIAQGPLTPDVGLQKLVYLMVPSLFKTELERRRHFRQVNPQCSNLNQPPIGAPDLCFDEPVSLSLSDLDSTTPEGSTRYLKCPAGVTVRHLTRLLMLKRGWDDVEGTGQPSGNSKIEVMYEVKGPRSKTELEILDPAWTLMDLSCIFEWKREAPMKLLYRISRIVESNSNKPFSISNTTTNNVNNSSQIIENIQRPPTPPPSPKPTIRSSLSTTPSMVADQYSKDFELKKPRCEVTPVMRAPDLYPTENRIKPGKPPKIEHQHKRKKRKNKIIAEITTTPREDLLKLKVRLTPCPPKITTSSNDEIKLKDKMLQIKSSKKEKTKSSHKHRSSKSHKSSPRSDEERNLCTTENFVKPVEPITVVPDKVTVTAAPENPVDKKIETPEPSDKLVVVEEPPKTDEVLLKLGLVAVSEANKTRKEAAQSTQSNTNKNDPSVEREKLEKQLRESKANRVRSLLAEKQMRDTLKSIMSTSKEPNLVGASSASVRCPTPTPNSLKRKDPPPLTPLRNAKRPNVTFAPNSYPIPGKYESPLDLSSPANVLKDKVLDLSSSLAEATTAKAKVEDKPVGILRNTGVKQTGDKSKDEPKKTQESANLRILSDAAVSLTDINLPLMDKSKLTHGLLGISGSDANRSISSKVALKIPQPHQRITGFGLKIKPNLGVRHIPNPQAVVASQYRNQRTGYFNLVQQPP